MLTHSSAQRAGIGKPAPASAARPRDRFAVPPIVHEVLGMSGQPLDAQARRLMQSRLGHDLSGVRVHTDSKAADSARAVDASAYTVGAHVVFGQGRYQPRTGPGAQLLAHELVHTVQQRMAAGPPSRLEISPPEDRAEAEARNLGGRSVRSVAGPCLQRAPVKLGTKVVEPPGVPAPFKTVSATFDGAQFVLTGDGKLILTAAAQSGHPNTVEAADAKACGGAASDSYLNNARYVGIRDKGPIPEGVYEFLHSNMVTFTIGEDAQMALAKPGEYADPSGLDLHGDWGAARVALSPKTIVPAKFCGNTRARSGFYLHGGVMTGSSGCIDIGNAGVSQVVALLMGYKNPVPVKVKYTAPTPTPSWLQKQAGKFMYPSKKDAGIVDRLESLFGD
jgi:hypothetical protein